MRLENNTRLVMTGDSITDTGRARPVGEGRGGALGTGYVSMVNALLFATRPDCGIHVMNTGVSGNQVPSLLERWQTDVLDLNPDYVSILIGINDVWRFFDCPNQPDRHVDPDTYHAGLKKMINDSKPCTKGIIVMSPYMVEPNRSDAMRKKMDEYAALAKSAAQECGACFVDVQAAFDRALQYIHPYYIAWDRIHPEAPGHMIIAKAFMDAVG